MVESFWYGLIFWVGIVFIIMGVFVVPMLKRCCKEWLRIFMPAGMAGVFLSVLFLGKCAYEGKPLPFDILKENQVYEVVEKMPETRMIFIKIKARDEEDSRIVEISEFFDELGKGERFVKIKGGIAKLP